MPGDAATRLEVSMPKVEVANDSWVLVLSLAGTLEEIFLSCADDKTGAGRLLGRWIVVTVELSLEVLVLSLSGSEVVRPPVRNALETVIVWSLLGIVDFVLLSLSGIETVVPFVTELLEMVDVLSLSESAGVDVLSLVGTVVVIVLCLSVVEAAVPFVPELLEMAVVLYLSGCVDDDVLSLSGNEVVTLSLLGTIGVTETVETTLVEDVEDGIGTTETVVLS